MDSCASAKWDMAVYHIGILRIGLELAGNGGLRGGILLKEINVIFSVLDWD